MSSQSKGYENQQKLALIEFLLEVPNFILVTASVMATDSMIMWMDFVDSVFNLLTAAWVVYITSRLKKDLQFEYNYGVKKLDAMAALFCDAMLLCGILCSSVDALIELGDPRQPAEALLYVIVLKVVCVVIDLYYVISQYHITKVSQSRVSKTELSSCCYALSFDAAALLVVFISYYFRENRMAWYLSPVSCLIIAIFFVVQSTGRIKTSVAVLTDKTLPEEEQMKVLKVLTSHDDQYTSFDAVKSRKNGTDVFIDLDIGFDESMTFGEIKQFHNHVASEIESQIPNSTVSFVLAGHSDVSRKGREEE